MSEKHSDRTFFVRFGVVALVLHGVIGGFALIAYGVGEEPRQIHRERMLIEERIAPVARIATRADQIVAPPTADQPLAVAAQKTRSGDEIVTQVCGACHGPGLMNAPKVGDRDAWTLRERAAGGLAGLVASASRGVRQMPPRGGAPELSDGQLRAAIEAMRR